MKFTELHSLTEELVQHCIDDRTIDFTLALMDFAQWDYARQRQTDITTLPQGGWSVGVGSVGHKNTAGIGQVESLAMGSTTLSKQEGEVKAEKEGEKEGEVQRYVWPDFVLAMLKKPTDWASWRKRVERSISGLNDVGKHCHVAELQSHCLLCVCVCVCWRCYVI